MVFIFSFYLLIELTSGLPKDHVVQNAFHETINIVEQMLDLNEIAADPDKIYGFIEKIAYTRNEKSVKQLIDYVSSKITSTQHPQWLQLLIDFMERFYKMNNTNIRLKALQSLTQIMDYNR